MHARTRERTPKHRHPMSLFVRPSSLLLINLLIIAVPRQGNSAMNSQSSATQPNESPTTEQLSDLGQSGFIETTAQNTNTDSAISASALSMVEILALYPSFSYGDSCFIAMQNANEGDYALCRCYGLYCPPFNPDMPISDLKTYRAANWANAMHIFYNNYQYNVAIIVTFSIIGLFGIIGNVMVIFTTTCFMRDIGATFYYVPLVACADILLLAAGIPLKIMEYILNTWPSPSDYSCKLVYFIRDWTYFCSTLTLCVMAIERYIAICFPMKAQRLSSNSRVKKTIAIIPVAAALLSIPGLYFWTLDDLQSCVLRTETFFDTFKYYGYIAAFLIALILITTVCYVQTVMALFKSIQQSQQLSGSESGKKSESGDKTKTSGDVQIRLEVVRMLITVNVAFIVGWSPIWIYYIGYYAKKFSPPNNVYWEFGFLSLTFVSCALNPFLYGLSSRQFRKAFRRCFFCCKSDTVNNGRMLTRASKSHATGISSVSDGQSLANTT